MNKKNHVDIDALRMGMTFPPELVGMIGDEAQQALMEWLIRTEAPVAVMDTLNGAFYLAFLMLQNPDKFLKENGRERWNAELEETISVLTWGIKALGGKFGDQPCHALIADS